MGRRRGEAEVTVREGTGAADRGARRAERLHSASSSVSGSCSPEQPSKSIKSGSGDELRSMLGRGRGRDELEPEAEARGEQPAGAGTVAARAVIGRRSGPEKVAMMEMGVELVSKEET